MTEAGRRCERGLVRGSQRPTPHLTSPLKGGRDELGKRASVDRGGRWCSGLFLFDVFGGDPRGAPIWSGRLAVFGFVRICSGLFRGDAAWVAGGAAERRTRAPNTYPKKIHPSPLSGGRDELGKRVGVDRGGRWCSGLFFSACSGVIRGVRLSGRGGWRCSGLFGFVQVCSGVMRRGWPAERRSAAPAHQTPTHQTPTQRKFIPPPFQGGG